MYFLCGLTCNKSIFLMEVFYIKQELPINGQIRAKEVQLIGENGEKLGVVDFREALDMAEEKKLDLVLVAPNAKPVVCKNFGQRRCQHAELPRRLTGEDYLLLIDLPGCFRDVHGMVADTLKV